MAEAVLHDCDTQKNEIAELLKTQLIEGDTWYLVDAKWFKQWKKYVGFDTWDARCVGDETVFPGPIDNSPLCKEGTKNTLTEHLIDELDYNLVPEDAWKKLVSWYNIVDPEMVLSGKVIEQGLFAKHCKVEVYLLELKLCHNRDLDHVITEQFSKADTIECVERKMQQAFNISDDSEVRLWNKYMSNTYEHLNRSDHTIQDAGLYYGTVIVIEEKNADGTWPRKTNVTSTYNSPGGSAYNMMQTRSNVKRSPAKTKTDNSPGVGVNNTSPTKVTRAPSDTSTYNSPDVSACNMMQTRSNVKRSPAKTKTDNSPGVSVNNTSPTKVTRSPSETSANNSTGGSASNASQTKVNGSHAKTSANDSPGVSASNTSQTKVNGSHAKSLPDNSDKAEGGSPDGQQENSVTGLHGLSNHGNTSLTTLQNTATTTPCEYSVPTNVEADIAKAYKELQNCISQHQQNICIQRDAVMNDLLERYKDENITYDHLCVEFLGEPGADTGGLTKELFTCFWSEASRNLFRGEHCLVPDLPLHRMRKESWKFVSLGRILSHMVALTGTIPHTLARSTFIKLATNSKVDDITLLEDFLLFVTSHERALLSKAMSSSSSLTEAESEWLSSFYSAHGYLDIPRKTEICEQILAIAEQELVQKPAHLTSLMHQGIPLRHRDAFWKHLSVGHITELMQSQKPTPERVAAAIASDKDDLTADEDRTMYFLKEFVATLDSDSLMAFLIFVTGSMYQPDKITVTFIKLTGIQRRPVSHTCSNVLELPTSYHSCQDFRREFKQVLSSPEAFQFSIV